MSKFFLPFIFFIFIGCVPKQIEKTECNCEEQEENKKTEECNIIEVKDKPDENVIPYSQLKEAEWYEVDTTLLHSFVNCGTDRTHLVISKRS